MNPIEINSNKILKVLFENNPNKDIQFLGDNINQLTGIEPNDINDAIDYLDKLGLLDRLDYMGTSPYLFGEISLNSSGNFQYHEMNKTKNQSKKNSTMKVFVSHSHKDVEIAKGLVELLRGALNLTVEDIRCTSVDGYRLQAGISTDEQLRMEIHDSEVLIGLISPASISSYYVLFELGARWGSDKPLIPLLSSEKSIELLKGPLQGITALNAKEEGQLFQLVTDIATILKIRPENPQSYQVQIKRLIGVIQNLENDVIDKSEDLVDNNKFDYSDADSKIKVHCKSYWPNDFSMQVSCIKEQQDAVKILIKGKPNDISNDDFILVRKCAEENWPDDYSMRVSQENEQFEAIRKLRTM